MFKHSKLLIGAFALTVGLHGCASFDIEKSPASSVARGFTAKKEYPVSFDKMWGTVRNVLDGERIPVATSDKSEGRITTEYIKGQQKMVIGLFGAVGITKRHKYSISLDKKPSAVRVNIIAMVEVQETEGSGWRPLGDQTEAKALEDWLYEKIEKAL